jgi:integrase
MKRHENKGLRKICGCARTKWTKCDHPWHFNFKPKNRARHNPQSKDGSYRFSLDKVLDRHIDSKSEAEDEAAKIRIAIKAGTFGQPAPVRESLTIGQLLDSYKERYIDVETPDSAENASYLVGAINKVDLVRPDGQTLAFGNWRVLDVSTDTLERFKEIRRTRGVVGMNRSLALLRAALNWAVRTKQIAETPFKIGTETVVKLADEHTRSRRLDPDEQAALLAACGPHLRGLVEAAIETGCRKGELLSLQWHQVEGMKLDEKKTVTWASRSELFLPFKKTKTKRDRRIPISTRLRAILECGAMTRQEIPTRPTPLCSAARLALGYSACREHGARRS